MTGPRGNRLLVVAAALATAAAGSAKGGEPRLAVWGFSAAADDTEGASLGERLALLTEGELLPADVALVGSVFRAGQHEGRIVTMKAVETASGKVLDACAASVSLLRTAAAWRGQHGGPDCAARLRAVA